MSTVPDDIRTEIEVAIRAYVALAAESFSAIDSVDWTGFDADDDDFVAPFARRFKDEPVRLLVAIARVLAASSVLRTRGAEGKDQMTGLRIRAAAVTDALHGSLTNHPGGPEAALRQSPELFEAAGFATLPGLNDALCAYNFEEVRGEPGPKTIERVRRHVASLSGRFIGNVTPDALKRTSGWLAKQWRKQAVPGQSLRPALRRTLERGMQDVMLRFDGDLRIAKSAYITEDTGASRLDDDDLIRFVVQTLLEVSRESWREAIVDLVINARFEQWFDWGE